MASTSSDISMENEGESKNATILLVEDDDDLRNGLRLILSAEGYTVVSASNGEEGLVKMKLTNPDLILSDITMPVMDGYQFYDAVRSLPEGVTIPFVFLTARGDPDNIIRGKNLGAEDYLVKPVTQSELLAVVQSRLERFDQLRLAQLENAYLASLMLLANAIELKDHYTRGHIERVTEYATVIAQMMGFSGKRLQYLRFGAALHDIGKILVDERVWLKAGPLNPEELKMMMLHPSKGAEMLQDIDYLAPAIPAIRHHHERWDGNGYPDGLVGEAIPLEGRIIAVADSFDAMSTTRNYLSAREFSQAFAEILHEAGSRYDPDVVSAFQRAWEAGHIHAIAEKWGIDTAAGP